MTLARSEPEPYAASPHSHSGDFFSSDSRFLPVKEEEIDIALKRGNLAVAESLTQTAINAHTGFFSPELARILLKQASIPHYAHFNFIKERIYEGIPVPEEITEQLDQSYKQSASILERAREARTMMKFGNTPESLERYRHLTGIMSEIAIFSLMTRQGKESEFIPLPASLEEDNSSLVETKKRNGIDMLAVPADDWVLEASLQIKTSSRFSQRYVRGITLVELDHITGLYDDENQPGALVDAIIRDANEDVDHKTYRSLRSAERRLGKKITSGLFHRYRK